MAKSVLDTDKWEQLAEAAGYNATKFAESGGTVFCFPVKNIGNADRCGLERKSRACEGSACWFS